MKVAYLNADGTIGGIGRIGDNATLNENTIQITDDFDTTNKKWNGTSWETYTPDPAPEPTPEQPTNQDIMDKLNAMTTGHVSTAELDAAYREGVNSYE